MGKDDLNRRYHSDIILSQYGICGMELPFPLTTEHWRYHASGWEFVLGVATKCIFKESRQYQLRHTLTFGFYLLGFLGIAFLLRSISVNHVTIVFSLLLLFSNIRLGGHALFNVKDAPAAITYLFATVAVWRVSKEIFEGKRSHSPLQYTLLGIVAVLPFLTRTPLLLHVGLLGCVVLSALFQRYRSERFRWLFVFLAPISAALMLYAFYPILWVEGPIDGIIGSLKTGASYESREVFAFGSIYTSTDLPRWYPLPWFLIQYSWLASIFLFFLIPSVLTAIRQCITFLLQKNSRTFSVENFWLYLWIVFCAGFLIVCIVHPALYEQDRHILFLYPISALLMAHGFSIILQKSSYQKLIGIVLGSSLFLSSMITYWNWGRLSYTHENILVQWLAPKLVRTWYKDYFELLRYYALQRALEVHAISGPVFTGEDSPQGYIQSLEEELSISPLPVTFINSVELCSTQKITFIETEWMLGNLLASRSCDKKIIEKVRLGTSTEAVLIAELSPAKAVE